MMISPFLPFGFVNNTNSTSTLSYQCTQPQQQPQKALASSSTNTPSTSTYLPVALPFQAMMMTTMLSPMFSFVPMSPVAPVKKQDLDEGEPPPCEEPSPKKRRGCARNRQDPDSTASCNRFRCHYDGCNRHFHEANLLRLHLRIHTGEKPYGCKHPGCSKVFADRSNFRRHQIMHTGVKLYQCQEPECLRSQIAFSRSNTLRKHMMERHRFQVDQALVAVKKSRQASIKMIRKIKVENGLETHISYVAANGEGSLGPSSSNL